MVRINYQVAKLMLIFIKEEHARYKQIADEIWTRRQAYIREVSFDNSGRHMYPNDHDVPFSYVMEQQSLYDTLSREALVLERHLETLIYDEDWAYKIEIAWSCN
jgi:hypothetical protein